MAGSYSHMTSRDGRLLGNERFTGMIENLGDAYEAAEECYGMIWWLAEAIASERQVIRSPGRGNAAGRAEITAVIEEARAHWRDGLETGGVAEDRS